MEHRAFILVLGILGGLSLLFQTIGLFSPAWLLLDMKINMNETQLNENVAVGLFAGHACVDTPFGKQCTTFTTDMLANPTGNPDESDSSNTATNGLIVDFLPLKVLTIFGLIVSIAALCAVVVYGLIASKDSVRKYSGVLGACLWIVSGILLMAAVGYEANEYADLKRTLDMLSSMPEIGDQLNMSLHCPAAAAMTCIGALLCFLNGLMVAVRMYYDKDGTGVVGIWNRFTNQAV